VLRVAGDDRTQPSEWIIGLAADQGIRSTPENTALTSQRGDLDAAVSVPSGLCRIRAEPDTGVFLRGLAVMTDGTIYLAAAGCGAVLRISPRGDVTPVHRTTSPWSPTAVAVDGNDVYVLEYLHTAQEDRQAWIPRVRLLHADGTAVLLATVRR
jgi:hypothetical protein